MVLRGSGCRRLVLLCESQHAHTEHAMVHICAAYTTQLLCNRVVCVVRRGFKLNSD